MAEIILPHDDHMEKAVLGAILSGHPQSAELLDTLKTEDFFNKFHKRIAASLLAVSSAGSRPDLLSVHDELNRNGETEAAGGISYVAGLVDG